MPVSAARRAAYEVLLRVFEQDAYADRVFRTAARDLDERDRAFAQRLAYGAVQRRRTLDYAIDTLGKRPTRKLDPPVRAALRLGAYQLGYTDTAPHAAANESVELVRGARLERAVPFTNAVMRRLTEGIQRLLDELPEGALKESYPDWIAETFARDLGDEQAVALMRAMNEPLETVVRLVRGEPPIGILSIGDVAIASSSDRKTASASSISARRPAGRRASLRVRSPPSSSIRTVRASCARTSRRSAGRTSPSSRRTAGRCRRSSPASTARSSTRRAQGSACSGSDRISVGARRRCPSSSSPCSARPPTE